MPNLFLMAFFIYHILFFQTALLQLGVQTYTCILTSTTTVPYFEMSSRLASMWIDNFFSVANFQCQIFIFRLFLVILLNISSRLA